MRPEDLIAALDALFPGRDRPLSVHEPLLGPAEAAAVARCVTSGWVSYLGPEVAELERRLAETCQCGQAVATVSGTAALHLALLLAGVEPDDEVLVPALTFAATANAVAYAGAVPHFVDIEPTSLGVCADRLDRHLAAVAEPVGGALRNRGTGRRLAALVVVHVFGHPADLDALEVVCARHGLPLIEDAAEALGSRYHGAPVGRHGLAALSFNGNKIVTAGGGGALLTADPDLARLGRHLATTAKTPHPYALAHDRLGYNYRLPNLNAALALAQLDRLDEFLARKRALAQRYAAALAAVPGAEFLAEPPGCRSNYWLATAVLDRVEPGRRDRLFSAARQAGYLIRPAWDLCCDAPHFAHCPRADLSVSRDLQPRLVNLPSSAFLEPWPPRPEANP